MGRRAADDTEQTFYQALGERIRTARQDKGLIQADLALVLDVTKGMIGQIERGQTRLYAHQLAKLADLLGVSPGMLLGQGSAEGVRDESLQYRLERVEQLKPEHVTRIKALLDAYMVNIGKKDRRG